MNDNRSRECIAELEVENKRLFSRVDDLQCYLDYDRHSGHQDLDNMQEKVDEWNRLSANEDGDPDVDGDLMGRQVPWLINEALDLRAQLAAMQPMVDSSVILHKSFGSVADECGKALGQFHDACEAYLAEQQGAWGGKPEQGKDEG